MNFETYKGIEFIRISALPQEEQATIRKTLDQSKIIKILRENVVLNDCIQATDYDEWRAANRQTAISTTAAPALVSELKLAFK